jgi:DNA-binding NarL/FixJ family response regulator
MTRILVIEDEKDLLEEILTLLELEDFDAIGAKDGLEGVQLAREHLPDLIISDVMMPHLSGFEVLEELSADSLTAIIPFIFLTAKAGHDDMRKGMALGADDYVTKPFTNYEILSSIKARLDKKQTLDSQQLRRFSHRLIDGLENERRNLADALRDEVLQPLSGLKISLEMSRHIPAEGIPAILDDLHKSVGRLLNQIDALTLDLWPAMLDHLGLLPALLWHFENFSHQTGVSVKFEHTELERVTESAVKLGAYRILQEALTNVARHANVNQALVRAWTEDNSLVIEIEDHGRGFQVESILNSGELGGLIAMRERALALGGELTISSAPRQGANLILRLPMKHPGTAHPKRTTGQTAVISAQSIDYSAKIDQRLDAPARMTPQPDKSPSNTSTITVVLAVGHEFIRHGLQSVIQAEADFAVIGEADHGMETVETVSRLQPDVLILDLMMPGMSGLDITRQLSSQQSPTRILILSIKANEAYVLEALRNGASGYILKDASIEELATAIREVAAGRRFLSSTLSERALETYISDHNAQQSTLDSYGMLTNREREILQLVVEGNTNTEIAEALTISPRTAETHRANMMRKLGVRNQADLIRYALQRGLIPLDS